MSICDSSDVSDRSLGHKCKFRGKKTLETSYSQGREIAFYFLSESGGSLTCFLTESNFDLPREASKLKLTAIEGKCFINAFQVQANL